MKTKIYSLLMMLFLGLTFGFTSCSSDDDDDSSESSSYEEGKTEGEKFVQAYDAYTAEDATLEEKTTQALAFYTSYTKYKSNKENSDWKKGFLAGAAKEDASKYDSLEKLMSTDFNNVTEIATLITDLSSLFSSNN